MTSDYLSITQVRGVEMKRTLKIRGIHASWGDITIVLSFCLVLAIVGVAIAGSANTLLFYVLWALAGIAWLAHMTILCVKGLKNR